MTTSCATTVLIEDQEWCADIGSGGAICKHTFYSDEEDIPEAKWDDLRFGMVATTGKNYARMKAELEALCKISGACVYDKTGKKDSIYIDQSLSTEGSGKSD